MALTKQLAEHTLRELLEALSAETLRPGQQILEAVRKTFGLDIVFTTAPGADITDRIARQLGEVRSEWLGHVRAGRAFHLATSTGPIAATNSHVQLFNPAASTKTVLVYRVGVLIPAAGEVNLRSHNAALAVLVGNGQNLRPGQPVSVAEIRTENNAAILGTAAQRLRVLADTVLDFSAEEWVGELAPGFGFHVVPTTQNQQAYGQYLWAEV